METDHALHALAALAQGRCVPVLIDRYDCNEAGLLGLTHGGDWCVTHTGTAVPSSYVGIAAPTLDLE